MSKLIIPKIDIKSVKVDCEQSEEYKKLITQANERIKENRRIEAETWIGASTYISN